MTHRRGDPDRHAIPLVTLPSTSPANALPYAKKLKAWKEFLAKVLT